MQPGRATQRGRSLASGALALGLMLLLPALSAGALGATTPQIETLRVGFVGATQGNLFKIGAWTPLEVQLKGGTERFTGVLEVEVPDDDGTPTFFRQSVDVPAGQTIRVVSYARPGTRDPNFMIRLLDERGRRQAQAEGSSLAQLSPIMPDETLLLTLGKASGVEQMPGLPGFTNDKSPALGNGPGGSELTVARVDALNGNLPGRWYGFDAAEVVVVDTNDKDLLQAFSVRGQALVDWVARGGHVVVAVGGNWQAARDSVLGPILPALPTGQERLPSLEALDSFASATKPITPPGSPPVQVTKLGEVESRGGKILSASGSIPLVVRGPHGFGRVTLVAFDVDQKPFSDWPDRAQFWLKAMDLRSHRPQEAGEAVRIGGGGRSLYQNGISDLATQLRQTMEQFPGVKLIPFGWVAFFIFLYILLIGPGDYFFLKKVVKRMELTWITFPVIVISVSVLAYFAAYLVKGKELRVNKIDVVDVDQATGQARGTTFVNLFSPQNRDYDVSVLPLPLDQPVPKDSASAIVGGSTPPRAHAGMDVMVSWLGVPEAGFGGMGGTGRIGFSGGGYACTPLGSSESLEGVRIPIWSTKLIAARWFGPSAPVADSDLLPVGTDRLSGTVTNRLAVPLKDAIVAFGKHVYLLGDLAPGATVRVELSQDRQLSGLLKSKYVNVVPDNSNPDAKILRPDLMLALMFHDSQGTSTSDRPVESNPLHYLDLTGQLALDRPMLVGRVDRPASTLVLGHAPSTPKVDQTTMIRAILPLAKPPGPRAN